MSGTFIISQEGRIELPYYYDNIADHPPLELLLNGVLATSWDASFEGPVGPGVEKSARRRRERKMKQALSVASLPGA